FAMERCCLLFSRMRSAPRNWTRFAAQYLAHGLPCERFTAALASRTSCITRGRGGWLNLPRGGLPPPILCQLPGALRYGSKGEELNLSKCGPVSTRKQTSADRLVVSQMCQHVWPGPALQDGFPRTTNVRAASMYQVSEWSKFCSGPSWVSARIQAD